MVLQHMQSCRLCWVAGCFNIGTVIGLALTPPLTTCMPWQAAFTLQGTALTALLAVSFCACPSILRRPRSRHSLSANHKGALQKAKAPHRLNDGNIRSGKLDTLASALQADAWHTELSGSYAGKVASEEVAPSGETQCSDAVGAGDSFLRASAHRRVSSSKGSISSALPSVVGFDRVNAGLRTEALPSSQQRDAHNEVAEVSGMALDLLAAEESGAYPVPADEGSASWQEAEENRECLHTERRLSLRKRPGASVSLAKPIDGSKEDPHFACGAAVLVGEATQNGDKVGTKLGERANKKRSQWLSLAALVWVHSAIGWGFFTFQHWIPTYLQTFEVSSPAALGAMSALPWAVTAACAFASGRLFVSLRARGIGAFTVQTIAHTCACLGASAALVPMLLWPHSGPTLSITCIGAALALQTCNYSGFHAYVQSFGAERAGAVLGVTNSCGIVTGLIANECLGTAVAVTGSYASMFAATAAVYASSWAMWMICLRGEPLDI
jgi:hypothetical protein